MTFFSLSEICLKMELMMRIIEDAYCKIFCVLEDYFNFYIFVVYNLIYLGCSSSYCFTVFNFTSSCSLHGLIRGENMELGRDSDTGGQVASFVKFLLTWLLTCYLPDCLSSPSYLYLPYPTNLHVFSTAPVSQ